MNTAHTLEQIVEFRISESVHALGYEIVRVALLEGKRSTLQIMIDRLDGQPVTVDDCAKVSDTVSALLDVEDPITDAYNLEISSPGIDRPLVKKKDYVRFIGFDVKINTREALEGRKRFAGIIEAVEENHVMVRIPHPEQVVEIPFSVIASAKLVLTEKLLAAYQA